MKTSNMHIFRFENSKRIELGNYRDDLGIDKQLGALIYIKSHQT